MAYHKGQSFNENHLRPCPMLENPDILRKIVKESGAHSTDLESFEDVDHLCSKCDEYAKKWQPVADKIWNEPEHLKKLEEQKGRYQNYSKEYKKGN